MYRHFVSARALACIGVLLLVDLLKLSTKMDLGNFISLLARRWDVYREIVGGLHAGTRGVKCSHILIVFARFFQ